MDLISDLRINLSISGGGVKGIAHLGGIKALEEEGIEIVSLAGSSVGAIIATLYGAGYSIDKLKELIYQQDLEDFKDDFSIIRLFTEYGIYKGNEFLDWMAERLEAKGVRVFEDLNKEVKVIASDATYRSTKVFSKEQTPQFSVAKAVRMSMSIPIFYKPYHYNSRLYIDGGVMNNFPLQVFADSSRPTLGLILIDEKPGQPSKIDNLIDYLTNLLEMVMTVNERRQIELSDAYVISIPTLGIKVIDFSLSREEKNKLYMSGYQQVKDNLDYFIDRKLPADFRGKNNRQLEGTTVEIEEYSQVMEGYIRKQVKLKQIDGIVTLNDDNYLFAYLVAKRLGKKFTVIDLDGRDSYSHYNRIESDDTVLFVNFIQPTRNKIKGLLHFIWNQGARAKAGYFFIGQRKKIRVYKQEFPVHNYYKREG
ncbi:putative esterase of the alpha-beta hydrolase superfamily [Halobacteroides halobius DSM 5150]|uniref:Putative esterase of the alpha-beta hydrolase superfamily n=1 Tax=Halobacteroides halobius (strain ATCC 35273 / DSM 5150 / MD-1) TaxID=748449 RepID=L0KD28_HALHC|nr:patatin-like phospholipase family protein [Halobacteroides halobius]AGB42450.1 putative esterase of the alpha-beta hydrolase superfamily [Halobacteroides halobius DSM 5150]